MEQKEPTVPELPEVEVVRRGLATHCVGRTISEAVLSGHRVARRHAAGPLDLADRLRGQLILSAERRGKYIWLVLEPIQQALVVHLGMSGQLLVIEAAAVPRRHQHATIDFVDGRNRLGFIDQRTFGGLAMDDLVPDRRSAQRPGVTARQFGVPKSIAHIACDPLEAGFDQEQVVSRLRGRTSAIKRLLLDQSLISGIGNIYADEALWRAQVHGACPGDELSEARLHRVVDCAREVMLEALEAGGTSFDELYVNVAGESGYFERSLSAYGRTGLPCPRCGTRIVRERFTNRSSHFCPRCQPPPAELGG